MTRSGRSIRTSSSRRGSEGGRPPHTVPDPPYLSVVIPAYNEESRIIPTLRQVTDFLRSQPYTWEVVVADDGSTDGTAVLVEEFARHHKNVSLLSLPHRGKGWAVKHGMLKSRGEYRFMCDADLSMPIEQLPLFLPPSTGYCDVALASREAPGARRVGEPPLRHLMGRVYNLLVRLLLRLNLKDTQCGFKCFRGAVASELFSLQRLTGFGFDIEVLFLSRQRGLRICEVPIEWHYRPRSKVSPLRDILAMSWDILRVRWFHFRGRYSPHR